MKKMGILLVSLMVALSFTACSKKKKSGGSTVTPVPVYPNGGYGNYNGQYPGYGFNQACGAQFQLVDANGQQCIDRNTGNTLINPSLCRCLDSSNNNTQVDPTLCQCNWSNPGYPVNGGYNNWNQAYNYGQQYGAGYPVYYPPYGGGAGFVGYLNMNPTQFYGNFGFNPYIYGYAGSQQPVYQGCHVGTDPNCYSPWGGQVGYRIY